MRYAGRSVIFRYCAVITDIRIRPKCRAKLGGFGSSICYSFAAQLCSLNVLMKRSRELIMISLLSIMHTETVKWRQEKGVDKYLARKLPGDKEAVIRRCKADGLLGVDVKVIQQHSMHGANQLPVLSST